MPDILPLLFAFSESIQVVPLLKVLHLIGALLWIGSLITLVYLTTLVLSDPQNQHDVIYKVYKKISMPMMIVTWICALAMLGLGWQYYAKAGFIHAKIFIVLIASGISGAISVKLRGLQDGNKPSMQSLRMLNLSLLICLVCILCLVMLKSLTLPTLLIGAACVVITAAFFLLLAR